ncbi:MAG: hypothetical protein ACOY46_04445 [Bacillota bacterium]
MPDRIKGLVLIGILICLVIIALKPVPQMSVNQPQTPGPGDSVIQLAENRIAIIETNNNSGAYGTILVFDYDTKTNSFKLLGKYDYSDYLRNPHIAKPILPQIK